MAVQTSEQELCDEFDARLLSLGDRCEWRKEVRVLCWTHVSKGNPNPLRIDYIIKLDGGPLLGVEVKAAPQQISDLGRALFQCAQYAYGIIAPATVDRVPPNWVGKPLEAVFLRTKASELPSNPASRSRSGYVFEHAMHAHRLYGPARVGFACITRYGLELRLCGNRYWTEDRGLHQGMTTLNHRSGNGSFRAE